MSKHFTKRCATSPTGGVSGMYLPQVAFRGLAADRRGEVHYVEYCGPLSFKEVLERQELDFQTAIVECYRR